MGEEIKTLDQGEVNRRKEHHGRRWFDMLYEGLDDRMRSLESLMRVFSDRILEHRDLAVTAARVTNNNVTDQNNDFKILAKVLDKHLVSCEKKQNLQSMLLFVVFIVEIVILVKLFFS